VEVISTDILGGNVLSIQYKDTNIYHQYGDTLSSSPEIDLEKSVANSLAPIKLKTDKLQLAFDSTVTIIKSLKDDAEREKLLASFAGMKRLMVTFDHLSAQISVAAENEKWRLASIEKSVDSIKYNLSLSDTVINDILANYNSIQDSLVKGNVKNAIMSSEKALAELEGIMTKISSGEGTIGQLLHSDELSTLLAQANTDFQLLLLDYDKHPERYVKVSMFSKRKKKNQDHFLTKEDREILKKILEGKKNGNK
jgi:phospholipid/cholesterol/gamma-HCH transport system substrate-binding protein